MHTGTVHALAQSADDVVRAIALRRLVHASSLTDEDRELLLEHLATLSLDLLMDLLARHGDLGCPAKIVERFIDALPMEAGQQTLDLCAFRWGLFLSGHLEPEAFADFVERVRHRVGAHIDGELLARVRGCELFDAVTKQDRERPPELHHRQPAPLAALLLDVRRDERACRARLEAAAAGEDLAELMRLTWVLARVAGCEDIGQAAWRRSLDLFAFPSPRWDDSDQERGLRAAHLEWVLAWAQGEAQDRSERLAWLADRVADAERDGRSLWLLWGSGAAKVELRDALARILVDRGELPRWALPVLKERLSTRSVEAWSAFFAWWRRWEAPYLGGHPDSKAILMEAPLPEDAPDDFDEEFLGCAARIIEHERSEVRMFLERLKQAGIEDAELLDAEELEPLRVNPLVFRPIAWCYPRLTISAMVGRLLELPLTPARAGRVARLIKDHPRLLEHPRIAEVAAMAGPIEANAVPDLAAINLDHPARVEVYRRLGGPLADERLRARVRAALSAAPDEPARRFGGLPSLLWSWGWLLDVLDDELRAEMRARVREAGFDEALRLSQSGLRLLQSNSWLVDEALLVELAARHLEQGDPWHHRELPPVLLPFVKERARRADDDHELVHLLSWLEDQGVPRSERMDLLLARLQRRPPSSEALTGAARLMVTRSAWEKDGPRFLRAWMRWNDARMVRLLWLQLIGELERAGAKGSGEASTGGAEAAREPVLWAMHLALATVALERAAAAAYAGDDARVIALLNAVLQLDPPPPIVRELRRLAKRTHLSERAVERLHAATKLFKSADGRAPTFDALCAATDAIVGAAAKPATAAS